MSIYIIVKERDLNKLFVGSADSKEELVAEFGLTDERDFITLVLSTALEAAKHSPLSFVKV